MEVNIRYVPSVSFEKSGRNNDYTSHQIRMTIWYLISRGDLVYCMFCYILLSLLIIAIVMEGKS